MDLLDSKSSHWTFISVHAAPRKTTLGSRGEKSQTCRDKIHLIKQLIALRWKSAISPRFILGIEIWFPGPITMISHQCVRTWKVGYKSQASFMLKTISKIQHHCQLKYWMTAFILLLHKSVRQPPEKKQFLLNPVCCEDNYKQLRVQRKQETLCRILSIYSKSKITEP